MKKEYDFSRGVRGKFYRNQKVQKTLRLDADVLEFFHKMAEAEGVPYQTLINMSLRKFAVEDGVLVISYPKTRRAVNTKKNSRSQRA